MLQKIELSLLTSIFQNRLKSPVEGNLLLNGSHYVILLRKCFNALRNELELIYLSVQIIETGNLIHFELFKSLRLPTDYQDTQTETY